MRHRRTGTPTAGVRMTAGAESMGRRLRVALRILLESQVAAQSQLATVHLPRSRGASAEPLGSESTLPSFNCRHPLEDPRKADATVEKKFCARPTTFRRMASTNCSTDRRLLDPIRRGEATHGTPVVPRGETAH